LRFRENLRKVFTNEISINVMNAFEGEWFSRFTLPETPAFSKSGEESRNLEICFFSFKRKEDQK
jgi:hypothetical protein